MTLDRPAFQRWLDRYIAAWRGNDPAAIADLFSGDARYRHRPTDEPIVGRDAIVSDWLEEPDDPARWEARYEVLAIDGEEHVANGWTRYLAADGSVEDGYANVYRCRFGEDGRCTDFTEWFTQDRAFE